MPCVLSRNVRHVQEQPGDVHRLLEAADTGFSTVDGHEYVTLWLLRVTCLALSNA